MPAKHVSVFMMIDSHMHTPLCNHAYGEPADYAAAAVKAGLSAITFTCHSPMPRGWWPQVRMRDEELEAYAALVAAASQEFEGRLTVRLGLESDWFPGMEPWLEALHQRQDFHYILGSVHYQNYLFQELFPPDDPFEFQKSYFNQLAESAESRLFDCLSHPDLVKNMEPKAWNWQEIRPFVAKALDRIAKTGVAMELNTSGLHKRYPEMNPGPAMLAMMAERGIPVVIGSDSHVAKRVGENFPKALDLLEIAGYKAVSYFVERKRHDIPMETARAAWLS